MAGGLWEWTRGAAKFRSLAALGGRQSGCAFAVGWHSQYAAGERTDATACALALKHGVG